MSASPVSSDTLQHQSKPTMAFWVALSGVLVLPSYFWFFIRPRGRFPSWSVLLPVLLAVGYSSWLYIVSAVVPEPYLDEIFHIPQAQKYCQGKFLEWDDKITTPPGLYLLSLLVPGVVAPDVSLGSYACTAQSLRAANAVALVILAYLAFRCRHEIEARLYEAHASRRLQVFSQYSFHTAFNIALFPLLFFFSGLYYTDVASTAAVLAAYLHHLKRLGRDRSSIFSDLSVVILGISTLFMRQTNVFWVVVYMGGIEAVHAVKTLRPQQVDQPLMSKVAEQVKFYAWRYSVGDIHDPPMNMPWPDDILFCILSLGIAALCNPFRVVGQIWPYITVLVSFGAFVMWNGGVVLGDKSNHVATIHLPQMLYIWPFFAFFSLPLLVPYVLPILNVILTTSLPTQSTSPGTGQGKPAQSTGQKSTMSRPLSKLLQFLVFLCKCRVLWPVYLLATVVLSVAIVRYNTIIHPFTLADNRHYMFYIFRYTIRRASWVRYALVLPYTVSRWMVWGVMGGCTLVSSRAYTDKCSVQYGRSSRESPYLNHGLWVRSGGVRSRQTSAPFPGPVSDASPETEATERELLAEDPLAFSAEPVPTSTGLIFLLATTLSLITAPLVEPRYFIIPWVIWRLMVPAWRLHEHEGSGILQRAAALNPLGSDLIKAFERYDCRLVLETLWFCAINAATGYIFLCRPYLWRSEDGALLDEGRLQRFMW